eukprot:118905-Amphidinium_carterae.1
MSLLNLLTMFQLSSYMLTSMSLDSVLFLLSFPVPSFLSSCIVSHRKIERCCVGAVCLDAALLFISSLLIMKSAMVLAGNGACSRCRAIPFIMA